jgi:hypothetical protein
VTRPPPLPVNPVPVNPGPGRDPELIEILKELTEGQKKQDGRLDDIDIRIGAVDDRLDDLGDKICKCEQEDIPTPPETPPRPPRLSDDDIDRISKKLKLTAPFVELWIYDDADNDGFYKDGNEYIPVPKSTPDNTGQEVFRIKARPPDPLEIRVEGLLKSKGS